MGADSKYQLFKLSQYLRGWINYFGIASGYQRCVHVRAAVACGITSKGPWRSSKTPGIQQALSNAYLKTQGLYSLRDGWVKLHYSE